MAPQAGSHLLDPGSRLTKLTRTPRALFGAYKHWREDRLGRARQSTGEEQPPVRPDLACRTGTLKRRRKKDPTGIEWIVAWGSRMPYDHDHDDHILGLFRGAVPESRFFRVRGHTRRRILRLPEYNDSVCIDSVFSFP